MCKSCYIFCACWNLIYTFFRLHFRNVFNLFGACSTSTSNVYLLHFTAPSIHRSINRGRPVINSFYINLTAYNTRVNIADFVSKVLMLFIHIFFIFHSLVPTFQPICCIVCQDPAHCPINFTDQVQYPWQTKTCRMSVLTTKVCIKSTCSRQIR